MQKSLDFYSALDVQVQNYEKSVTKLLYPLDYLFIYICPTELIRSYTSNVRYGRQVDELCCKSLIYRLLFLYLQLKLRHQ